MARKTIEQRIAELEQRKKTLVARLGKQERTRDTRRKVLLGALVLHHLDAGKESGSSHQLSEWVQRELPGFLTRQSDHDLFDDIIGATPTRTADTK